MNLCLLFYFRTHIILNVLVPPIPSSPPKRMCGCALNVCGVNLAEQPLRATVLMLRGPMTFLSVTIVENSWTKVIIWIFRFHCLSTPFSLFLSFSFSPSFSISFLFALLSVSLYLSLSLRFSISLTFSLIFSISLSLSHRHKSLKTD